MPEMSPPVQKLVIACTNVWQLAGLRAVLGNGSHIEVVGQATTPQAAIECIKAHDPTVVLVDLEDWGKHTLSFLQDVRAFNAHLRVVLLCHLENPDLLVAAMDLGVAMVVLKVQPTDVLMRQLEMLQDNSEMIASKNIPHGTAERGQTTFSAEEDGTRARIQRLTDREREIIACIGRGLTNKEIATRMDISFITVRHHLSRIFSKTGTDNRQRLLLFAHANQLVNNPATWHDDVPSFSE